MVSFKADFHLHTHFSDGTLSPQELSGRLAAAGVTHFAVTDHDTLSGLRQLLAQPESFRGLRCFIGVEINTSDADESVHILGYGSALVASMEFETSLERFRRARRQRMEKIVEKLASMGLPITLAGVESHFKETVGRPNIADALVAAGVAEHRQEAFRRFLLPGQPAYVPPLGPAPEEAIDIIRRAGGVAVLAHPGVASIDAKKLSSLTDAGLRGIEVFHPLHSCAQIQEYREQAKRLGLWVTCGSDYHGPGTGRDELFDFGIQEKDLAAFLEAIS